MASSRTCHLCPVVAPLLKTINAVRRICDTNAAGNLWKNPGNRECVAIPGRSPRPNARIPPSDYKDVDERLKELAKQYNVQLVAVTQTRPKLCLDDVLDDLGLDAM